MPDGLPAVHLGSQRWTEVAETADRIVLIPAGSFEQHGPHLPLDTDTRIAEAVARRLAATEPRLTLGPTIAVGASGEHAGFPGTLSIGTEALRTSIIELGRSADELGGVVVVNAHGGNIEALGAAEELLRSEGRRFHVAHCRVSGGDAHAGVVETSVMLHLDPSAVAMEHAAAGVTEPWEDVRGQIESGGVAAVSPSGVLGDPTLATAEQGARWFEEMVNGVSTEVRHWLDG